MDTETKKCQIINNQTNKSFRNLKPLCSSACVAAFYASRYDEEGVSLSLDAIS